MWDRNKKFFHGLLSVFVALSFAFSAFSCGGGANEQLGGIVGEVRFNTQACVPQQKIIKIRNDDTSNPQRVMGVYFELGTNEKNYYKIDKVVVGGTEYQPDSNLAQEVLIPAGGIMSVYVTYKPRKITSGGNHLSYLDLFLNGPKLGILQIKMNGEAATAAEGCVDTGNEKKFKVTKVQPHIQDGQNITVDANPITNITDGFKFSLSNDGEVKIEKDGFPAISIPNPSGVDVKADLLDDTYVGTFTEADGKLDFPEVEIEVAILNKTFETRLTTDTLQGSQGSVQMSLTGKPLASDGTMVVVLIAKLPTDIDQLENLKGGLFGAEIFLEEEK